MKIYTKTGDDGRTALFGGGRVPKDHVRVDAYGIIDELNAILGWCVTRVSDSRLVKRLETIQHDLFSVGATLATPPADPGRERPRTPELPVDRVEEMERWIDEAGDELPDLKAFVLPGGEEGASRLHVARTVCRRAERAVVHLSGLEAVDPSIIVYLNRLSDLLFTFARLENHGSGTGDVTWVKPEEGSPS
ncbi:MAG: cob(I)yrinic acid a,c-diamide adenosyltransferase [Longimicrobiales bacterium]|nr:cob(I)yrinic acid a,c-diamide adenosyltransferase [Longimicrobiales bacterium]